MMQAILLQRLETDPEVTGRLHSEYQLKMGRGIADQQMVADTYIHFLFIVRLSPKSVVG